MDPDFSLKLSKLKIYWNTVIQELRKVFSSCLIIRVVDLILKNL